MPLKCRFVKLSIKNLKYKYFSKRTYKVLAKTKKRISDAKDNGVGG